MTDRFALFSVGELRDIAGFGAAVASRGWGVIATHDAWSALRAAGIPALHIREFTGAGREYPFPPTLHPAIEEALTTEGASARIELVYDIPYPLERGNDVGGMTLLALAVKGGRIAVTEYGDMSRVARMLREDGGVPAAERAALGEKALAAAAAHYLALLRRGGAAAHDGMSGVARALLAHGENPYQAPAVLFETPEGGGDALSLPRFRQRSGEPPCFTTLADCDSILTTLCRLAEAFRKNIGRCPYITIAAKHGNPCGVAVDWDDPLPTIEGALWGDPQAVWGGEVVTNYALDARHADLLMRSARREKLHGSRAWMLDLIAAPAFSDEAVALLGGRARRALFQNEALAQPRLPDTPWSYRMVRGGFLRQPPASYVLDLAAVEQPGGRFDPAEVDALLISWAVAYTSSHGGNEIALASGRRLIGAGGGPSTVGAAETAVARARAHGHELRGSVFTADAFFPYRDAPCAIADAGCVAGLVPIGGKAEGEVRAAFRERGVRVGFIPAAYRGFCRH